ncbi:uncharacterized protein LOC132261415 [Phlebotomus argentipes]|uniref:uncharacterized protein LOC132261415 n=1 Tax=Phlebotomus argentipes TaxID=94469 RepID=UPI0028930324|nr:uncharacterized protein LOC132261415 [Phlebotomus argentipes]
MAGRSRRKTQHETLVDQDESSQICEEYVEDAQSDAEQGLKCCHFCGKDFPTSRKALLHERFCKNGSIERFICVICELNFKSKSSLERHVTRHEAPGGFLCPMCDETFTTDADRAQHRNTEHKVYRCQICEAKYGTEAEYVAHIVNQHGGKDREPVVCSDCGQQFRSTTQLKIHNDSKCGTVKMFGCNECNSRFMTANTLKAHKLIHLGEKKHLCNYCGNSFLSKGQLKVHERSHTGEKPFKCNECGKAFAYRESLVTHSSLHTGIRPYVCELCGSRFSCIGNLIKHRRSRPDTCGLPQFRRNSKVTPHKKAKNRAHLTTKLEKLVERNEISIVHQLQIVDQSEEIDVKEERNEVEIFNAAGVPQRATEESLATKIENISDVKPQVQEVLIHNAREAEDLEDDVPLSHLRSQVVTTKDQKFILTEVEIVPTVTKELPKRRPRQAKSVRKMRIKKSESADSDDSNDIDFLDVGDLPNASEGSEADEDYQPDEAEIKEEELEEPTDQIPHSQPKKRADRVSVTHEYKCDHCPKMFCYKTIFNLHLKREHNMDIKDEDLPNQQRYSKILFPRDRVHECRFCKRKYANKPALLKHEQVHGPEGNLHIKCRVCKEYFETHEKEKEHRVAKHKDQITCKECNKMYRDENHLQVHIRNCHTKTGVKKPQHLCGKCGKSFTSKTAMMDHERSDCGKSPIYQCDVCKKFYHSAGSLKTHKNVHTNELPNLCKYCGKGFRTQGQLKVHERIHTGEKPFQCTYCPKAFSHRESLLTHVSLHTGFKRFMCSGCGQRFTCISNLQAHRKAHADTCGLVPNCTKAVGPMEIHVQSMKNEDNEQEVLCVVRNSVEMVRESKNEDDQEIPSDEEEFNEDWVEYQEDTELDDKNEPFRVNCFYCNERFLSVEKRFLHERVCEIGPIERFPCQVCRINFRFEQGLRRHERRHQGSGGFLCRICDAKFTSVADRMHHKDAEHRVFRCQICEGKFRKQSDYVGHIVKVHSDCKCWILQKGVKDEELGRGSVQLACDKCGSNMGSLSEKLEQLMEGNEVSITHPMQVVETLENVREGSEERDEVVVINGEESEESLKKTLRSLRKKRKRSSPEKVLIQSVEDFPDLDDDMPLSQLKSQVECAKRERGRKTRSRRSTTDPIKTEGEGEEDSDDVDFFDVSDSLFGGSNPDTRDDQEHLADTKDGHEAASPPSDASACRLPEYRCKLCPQIYCFEKRYLVHLKTEHGIERPSKRDEGNQKQTLKNAYVLGYRKHACRHCKRRYASKEALVKHEKCHGPDGKLKVKCSLCNELFEDESQVKEHKKEFHKDEVTCTYCKKVYAGERNLQIHIELRHTKTKTLKKMSYLCGKCGKNFTSKTALLDHERSDCGKSPIYQCDVCKKFYHSAGSLKGHKSLHTKVKPFLCKFCGKSYRNPGQLRVHERTHTGEKPHKCTYCPKAFSHRETLLTHITMHTGFKRFMCSGCGKRFACISNLQVHRKAHADTCGLVPNCTKAVGPMDIHMIPQEEDQPENLTNRNWKKKKKRKSWRPCAAAETLRWAEGKMARESVDDNCQEFLSDEEEFSQDWVEYQEDIQLEDKNESFRQHCYYCGKEFSTARKRLWHERFCNQGSIERFSCRQCGLNFRYGQCLVRHEKRHEEPGGFPCPSCSAKFTSSTDRKQHRNAEHRVYRCQICDAKFRIQEDYVGHIMSIHSDCKCGAKNNSQETRSGNEVMRKKKVKLSCEKCGVEFISKHDLENHVQSLACEKPYKCNECGKSFSFQVSLITHTAQHSRGSRPNSCEKCGETFQSYEQLIKHRRANPYTCGLPVESKKKTPRRFSARQNVQNVDIGEEDKSQLQVFNGNLENVKKEATPEKVLIQNSDALDLDDDMPLSHLLGKDKRKFSPAEGKKEEEPSRRRLRKKRQEKNDTFSEDSDDDNFHDMSGHAQSPSTSFGSDSDSDFQESEKKGSDDGKELVRQRFECKMCSKVYLYQQKYVIHLRCEHGLVSDDEDWPVNINRKQKYKPRLRKYECHFCKRVYANSSSLGRHVRCHGPDGKLLTKCRVCKEFFENEDKLKEHREEAHKEKIKCNFCSKSYSGEHNLKTHIHLRHTDKALKKTTYLCGKCAKSFTSKTALTDHEKSDCGKSPIYQCDICNKFYHSAGSLKGHKTLHTKVRPFLCKYCGKPYRTPGQMREHERVHTGEKPHKCTYCPKAFSHRGSLLTHLSLHTGFKRYMCSGCGQRFTCISNLQAHRKSHADTCGLVPNCTKAMGRMESYMLPPEKLQDQVGQT